MGRRGAKPLPTALKLIRGDRPSRVNDREPLPRPGLPRPPVGISPATRKVWLRVTRELGETGVITVADTDTLRCYCEAVVRYEFSARALEDAGPLARSRRAGELVKNPLHQIVRDNAQLVLTFARELGLTPSARSGIRAPEAEGGSVGWLERQLPTRARVVGDDD